jgi:hypothetical protein
MWEAQKYMDPDRQHLFFWIRKDQDLKNDQDLKKSCVYVSSASYFRQLCVVYSDNPTPIFLLNRRYISAGESSVST